MDSPGLCHLMTVYIAVGTVTTVIWGLVESPKPVQVNAASEVTVANPGIHPWLQWCTG